jgi:hypothetical protein
MKHHFKTLVFSLVGVCVLSGMAYAVPMTAFQLNIRSTAVIPVEQRLVVLKVAEQILQREDTAFIGLLSDLPNPFVYQSRAVADALTAPEVPLEAPVEVQQSLSEQAVLDMIAANLLTRISGFLERGGNYFVQLRGGDLLRVGNQLPVRVPAIGEETFMITIIAINPATLVLGLGESRVNLAMPTTATGGARMAPAD